LYSYTVIFSYPGMSSAYVTVAATLESWGKVVYGLAFVISFLESLAFVGLLIPSTSLLLAFGFLVYAEVLRFDLVWLAVSCGGIVGDVVSYFLGTHGMQWFKPGNKLFKVEYLQKGEQFFSRHGTKSVFLARFLSPLRPIMPFVAGLFSMPRPRFAVYAVAGSLVSTALYVGIGYELAAVSYYSVGQASHTTRNTLIVGACAAFGVLVWWLSSRRGEMAVRAVKSFLSALLTSLMRFGPIERVLRHHRTARRWFNDRPHRTGIAVALIGALPLFGICVCLPWWKNWLETILVNYVDVTVSTQLFLERSSTGVALAYAVTQIFSPQGVVVWSVVISILLGLRKRWYEVLWYWVSVSGAAVMVAVIKYVVARPRPDVEIAVYSEHSASFPSFHAALSVVVLWWVVRLLNLRVWSQRLCAVLLASMCALYIGYTRVYLGVHYVSDVAVGFGIGVCWFIVGSGLLSSTRPHSVTPPQLDISTELG
jgi:undecaprenyl-diphosphatase